MILIAGGGLAGLSAAYHLNERGARYLLVEREAELGGLCRSLRKGDYTFDHSGHLLSFQDQGILSWVSSLMGDGLSCFERRSSVFIQGRYVPYPFQAHLGALPPRVRDECLADFVTEALRGGEGPCRDFVSWVERAFGRGMGRHFFFPYNRKLWGIPLEEIDPEELLWSIPRPSLSQVVEGALGGENRGMGYNPLFYYPKGGGIGELPRALARGLSGIRTGCGLERVRWADRTAVLDDGEEVRYEALISSVPLPQLLGMLRPMPEGLEGAGSSLRWVSVWVLNVGVRRPGVSDQHWVYFPEADYPFFRVGCYSSFAPHLAPEGASSLYVEVAGHAVRGLDDWVRACLQGLVRCGILESLEEVEVADPLELPVAYVIHDRPRRDWLPRIRAFLEGNGIHPVGRFGAWGYGTMEQALIQGRDAARRVG
jgi:protoporphyrinogen oxidase